MDAARIFFWTQSDGVVLVLLLLLLTELSTGPVVGTLALGDPTTRTLYSLSFIDRDATILVRSDLNCILYFSGRGSAGGKEIHVVLPSP